MRIGAWKAGEKYLSQDIVFLDEGKETFTATLESLNAAGTRVEAWVDPETEELSIKVRVRTPERGKRGIIVLVPMRSLYDIAEGEHYPRYCVPPASYGGKEIKTIPEVQKQIDLVTSALKEGTKRISGESTNDPDKNY